MKGQPFVKEHQQEIAAYIRSLDEPRWLVDQRLKALKALTRYCESSDFEAQAYQINSALSAAWQQIVGTDDAAQLTRDPAPSHFTGLQRSLAAQGVMLSSLLEAVHTHETLVEPKLGSLVSAWDDPYGLINVMLWRYGHLVYLPRAISLAMPLEHPALASGRPRDLMERTLVVLEEDAALTLIDGCSAAQRAGGTHRLHLHEMIVGRGASLKVVTLVDWRAAVRDDSLKLLDCAPESQVTLVQSSINPIDEGSPWRVMSAAGGWGVKLEHHELIMMAEGQHYRAEPLDLDHCLAKATIHDRRCIILCHGSQLRWTSKPQRQQVSAAVAGSLSCGFWDDNCRFIVDEAPLLAGDKKRSGQYRCESLAGLSAKRDYLSCRGFDTAASHQMLCQAIAGDIIEHFPLEYAVELSRLLDRGFS